MDGITLEQLIPQYAVALSALCLRLCRNRADAEDLYQETWLKLLRSNVRYRDAHSFRALLFGTAANLFRDHCRKRARLRESDPAEKEAYLMSIPTGNMDLQEQVALYDAIGHLSADHRTVLTLYYFEGLTVEDVSEMLGISPGTVKSRLHYAKRALRKELSV